MTTINAVNMPQLTTNGQIHIGSTGAYPVATTITQGTGLTVTNGAGAITLALTIPAVVTSGGTGLITGTTPYGVICAGTTATGAFQVLSALGASGTVLTSNGASALPSFQAAAGGMTWNNQSTNSVTMAVNNGYVITVGSLCTLTLPTTVAVGQAFAVVGFGASGWKIAQNASQLINFGTVVTTTGVGGSLASSNAFDCVEIMCTVANLQFSVRSSVGNLAYV